ncbi:MAG TPA: ribosome recycling factor [Dehalococcoidia bacterium]|nr:ribosome recycling factor [Dehalococcoidia bacterium]
MVTDPLGDARDRMAKALEATRREFDTIRTGRANPKLVEGLKVDYHGHPTPLQQLANVTVPEAHLIAVQPYDRSSVAAIEKSIRASDLGLNPTNDGSTIRIAIPPLTEQRRKELVKLVHKKAEEGRVAIRNIRRDAQDALRKRERAHEISEDEARRLLEQLQKATDDFIHKVEEESKTKEAEVLEV